MYARIITGEEMRILLITDYLPYLPISGDTIRVYNLIKRISLQHEIYLLALFETPNVQDSILHLENFCHQIEVVNHKWPNPLTCLPEMLLYYLRGWPMELRLLHSSKMANLIFDLTSTDSFDVVQIEHSRLALYREYINPQSHCATVLTFHNVALVQSERISRIEKSLVSRLRSWIFARQLYRWEAIYAGKFDRCFAVSEREREILLKRNPHLKVDLIPNGTDSKRYKPLDINRGPAALLFIGSMSYAPCIDGVVYFCKEILPHVQNIFQNINVWIVGADPSPDVIRLADQHVHVTGYVEDVLPYYQQATVSIVPLRAGGGTRLKILEAMALGRPVVSTTIGCEGLDVLDGQHLLVADEPKKFAEQIIRLLGDSVLYRYIATEARKLVEERYDWDVITEQSLDAYKAATN